MHQVCGRCYKHLKNTAIPGLVKHVSTESSCPSYSEPGQIPEPIDVLFYLGNAYIIGTDDVKQALWVLEAVYREHDLPEPNTPIAWQNAYAEQRWAPFPTSRNVVHLSQQSGSDNESKGKNLSMVSYVAVESGDHSVLNDCDLTAS